MSRNSVNNNGNGSNTVMPSVEERKKKFLENSQSLQQAAPKASDSTITSGSVKKIAELISKGSLPPPPSPPSKMKRK